MTTFSAPDDYSRHIEALRKRLPQGKLHVYGDGSLTQAEFEDYGTDRTALRKTPYSLLVFPANTREVAAILSYSCTHKLPVVPSGGRTGLSGGAVASQGEIVLSLKKMNRLLRFDPHLPALHVEAGMVTADVQKAAERHGFFFPLDLAASGSSQIGGNLATNAGGNRVICYGSLRNWVLGLTVVTGNGTVLRFPGRVLKNNTGFDLKQIFIGQEGTLGVITEAVLQLALQPQASRTCLLALADLQAALDLLARLRRAAVCPLAFEYWDAAAMASVCRHLGLRQPFVQSYKTYCLLEWEEDAKQTMLSLLEKMQTEGVVLEALLAGSTKQTDAFWKYREGISESLSVHKMLHKQDLSVPIGRMARFLNWTRLLLRKQFPELQAVFFGHIGDGNIHLNVFPARTLSPEDFSQACLRLNQRIYRRVSALHGSISAEHGIGLLKKDFLAYCRSPEELELMRSLKQLLDPRAILNPGKLL